MAREFIPDRVLSILAVPVLTWMGLSGSTQIACAQGRAYVANFGSNTVSVIDTSNNTVSAKVVVGGCPYDVAITPDGTRAYVVRDNANSVWAIDTSSNTVVAKVTVADTPGAIAITPDGTRAYVVSVGTLSVSPAVSRSEEHTS